MGALVKPYLRGLVQWPHRWSQNAIFSSIPSTRQCFKPHLLRKPLAAAQCCDDYSADEITSGGWLLHTVASVTGEDIRTAELLWQNKRLRTHPHRGTIQDNLSAKLSFTTFLCGSLWKLRELEKGLRRRSHDRSPPFCPAGPRENGSLRLQLQPRSYSASG